MDKKRVGMLGYYGWPRGLCYLMRSYVKMLEDDTDVFILKIGSNKIDQEFIVNAKIDEYVNQDKKYTVEPEVFKDWLKSNKIEHVFFFEYNQWSKENDLVTIANELGVKTYGYLAFERFTVTELDEYKKYYKIIAPTKFFQKKLRSVGLYNTEYVPFGIDFDEYQTTKVKNKKVTFLHIGGWGGVGNRKNTDAVIKAMERIPNNKHELIITSQKEFSMSRLELLDLINSCDCVILPSRWESISLPILESLALGKPVITTDASPMNEFVINNTNGFTVKCIQKPNQYVTCLSNEVDITDLSKKMEMMDNKLIRDTLTSNARVSVLQFDINKIKEKIIQVIS